VVAVHRVVLDPALVLPIQYHCFLPVVVVAIVVMAVQVVAVLVFRAHPVLPLLHQVAQEFLVKVITVVLVTFKVMLTDVLLVVVVVLAL
jgi:hypothetical protein